MKILLFFSLASSVRAVTPIINLPPLNAYPPHAHAAGMLGWTFTVHSTVTVTGVGWFDYGKDGLLSSVQVGLWKHVNGTDTQLLPEPVWTGSVAIDAPLYGDFRILSLSQQMTLSPGSYQLGGLHNGIDHGAFIEIDPTSDLISTNEVTAGTFFYHDPDNEWGRLDFGPVTSYDQSSGLEVGPILFIVPEPSSVMIGSLGMLVFLRRRRLGMPTTSQCMAGGGLAHGAGKGATDVSECTGGVVRSAQVEGGSAG